MFTYPTLLISYVYTVRYIFLLHLADAVQAITNSYIFCTYSYSFLHTCVYKVVVVKLLGWITC
jgi:hypothetical protein